MKIREEEEKRKEVSAKFQATMNEITTLMQQNNENNMKLRDDNIDMTAKLNSICEQYEARQQVSYADSLLRTALFDNNLTIADF